MFLAWEHRQVIRIASHLSSWSLCRIPQIVRGICLVAALIFGVSCDSGMNKDSPSSPGAESGKAGSSLDSGIKERAESTRTLTLANGVTLRLRMIDLPGGEFQMGGTEYDNEKPVHRVRIAPFSIGKYEVTQAEWSAVMNSNPSYFKGDKRPVENISWNDVQEFLQRLGNGYRLPTEAEWEYAARVGTTTEYSFGDDESKLGEYAWFSRNAGGQTHPVGQKKPNPFGLHDMHGNVWEWVEDPWHENYKGAPTDGSVWLTEGNNARRVLRGGSWDYYSYLRSANRNLNYPDVRNDYNGFRVVVGAQTQPGR